MWLSRLPEKKGEELGFVCVPRYGTSRGSEVVEAFSRQHYVFVHAKPEVWSGARSAIRLAIGERAFWLTADVLQSLEGKTLEVVRADVGQGLQSGRFREFQVANAHDEKA